MTDQLPTFPVDDATLLAVEHAMGGALTFERPEGADPDDEGPYLVGADYSLHTLLDFMGGTYDAGTPMEENPHLKRMEDSFHGIPTYLDDRVHYTEHDIIRALIAEVRRLRDGES